MFYIYLMKLRLLIFIIGLSLNVYSQSLDVNVLSIPDSLTTWDLRDVYSSNKEWDSTYNSLIGKIDLYKNYKSHLAESPEKLIDFLEFDTHTNVVFDQLSTYAFLSYCVELNNPTYTSM